MSDEISKTSEINLAVGMNENNVPLNIRWTAEDGSEESVAKAMILSLWDEREQNTMRIDLWTKDMTVDEMKRFYHQTMLTMADTFERATNESRMANEMREFGKFFGEKMGLITPGGN